MTQEEHHAEELQQESTDMPSELSAETIETQISEELAKVVGLDEDALRSYATFLGTLKAGEISKLLKRLKRELGEQVFPFLEILAQQDGKKVAEAGILALGTVQSLKAAQLLAEINETHPDKTLRKAARKSLYKLKSAGIEVESSQKPLLGASKHQPYKALISAVDGTGSQLIMISEEMLAGDLQLMQVVASDEEGFIECSSKRGATKKMFARIPQNFARELGNKAPVLVEADYDYAVSLILDIEKISEELDLEVSDEYLAAKAFFGLDQAEPVENPAFQTLDAENLRNQPYFLRASEELWQDDFFLGWLLPLNEVGEYAQELLDQDDTVIELSPQFQHQRKEEVYQKVLDDLLDDEAIRRLQRRLQIMAYVFTQQEGKEEDAKRALAAALAFDEMERPAFKNHPFLWQLIINSLEAAQDVIENGYDPDTLDREDYVPGRDDEGNIVVEIL